MTEVSAHSAGYEKVPRVWPFNATDKLGPDISELLSMHCSWCVLDCGEAQDAHAMRCGIFRPTAVWCVDMPPQGPVCASVIFFAPSSAPHLACSARCSSHRS